MKFSGMGPLPLDWTEIKDWAELQGIELEPQEAYAIRSLSNSYVDQHSKAKKRDCPQPWIDPEQISRQEVTEKVTSKFDALVSRRKKKSD